MIQNRDRFKIIALTESDDVRLYAVSNAWFKKHENELMGFDVEGYNDDLDMSLEEYMMDAETSDPKHVEGISWDFRAMIM